VLKLRKRGTGSNLADMGRGAVHGPFTGRADSEAGLACRRGGHGECLRRNVGYAADLPRSLPGSSCLPPREFPARHEGRLRAAPGPDPPGFEPVSHKGTVTHRFLAYSSPSRSPDPRHLAVLTRPGFVRGCSRPPRHHPDQAALSSAALLRQGQR
jgi:hypothetical protein